MSAPQVYETTFTVTDADTDGQGHVNNVAFLRYVQDVAVAHWRAVAPAELQAAFTWVVRRHEIDYLKPGQPGETFAIRTWVDSPSGATCDRVTEISRPLDGVLVVRARTTWVLLDPATLRPRRIDSRVAGCFSPSPE